MKTIEIEYLKSIADRKDDGITFEVKFKESNTYFVRQPLSRSKRFVGRNFFINRADEDGHVRGGDYVAVEARNVDVVIDFLFRCEEEKLDYRKCERQHDSLDVEAIMEVLG